MSNAKELIATKFREWQDTADPDGWMDLEAEILEKQILAAQWIAAEDSLPEESRETRYRVYGWFHNNSGDVEWTEVHARYFDGNWWQGSNPAALIMHITDWSPIIKPITKNTGVNL